MQLLTRILTAVVLTVGFSGYTHAATDYYLYQKEDSSDCDISTKAPSDYNRGSKWKHIATDSTRSGVKKQGEKMGCTSF